MSLLSLKDPNSVADAATGHFQEACFFAPQRAALWVGKIGRVNLYRQHLLEKRKKFNRYSVEVGKNRAAVSQAAVPALQGTLALILVTSHWP